MRPIAQFVIPSALIPLVWLPVFVAALAQDAAEQASAGSAVIARLNGRPLLQRELDRELAPARRLLDPAAQVPDELKKHALGQLIDRRLVLDYLLREKLAAGEQEVEFEVQRLKGRLAAQEKKLSDHLQSLDMTEAELRREFLWRISWQRYVDGRLTDDNLQKYFAAHRRDFDGTELRVAHLLLKMPADDPQAIERAKKQAADIRADIEAGKLSFADACRQHSQAPTAAGGGEIGLIRRHEPMPEVFSDAAFALEKGQVSPPVQTKFGIHLIQVLDVKPGETPWQECRAELRSAVTKYLFRWIADKERKTTQVEIFAAPQRN